MKKLTTYAVLAVLVLVGSAYADTTAHVLPYANANGYVTTRVVINPTGEPIPIQHPCQVGPCYGDTVPAFGVWRLSGWPREGVNVEAIELDSRLRAYSEIKNPLGMISRWPNLPPRQGADYYDLPFPSGEFESHIFVAVAKGDSGYYCANGECAFIDDTSAHLFPAPADRVRLDLGYDRVYPNLPAPASIYTFAIVVHHATGAITAQGPVE